MLDEALSPEHLHQVRHEIYIGSGYSVLRGFLHPEQAAYILDYWREHNNSAVVRNRFDKKRLFYRNCPNYTNLLHGRRVHFNFFWNAPSDALTYDVAWRIQRLRNQIEGNCASDNYFPVSDANLPVPAMRGRVTPAVSYRIVGTEEDGALDMHHDWAHDPSKVQLSLVLSAHKEDFLDGGFLFRTRDGNVVNLSRTESLRAGDLLVFRYNYDHGVAPVTAQSGQAGFWRMLLPIESLYFTQSLPAKAKPLNTAAWLKGKARQILKRTNNSLAAKDGSIDSGDQELSRLTELAIESGVSPSEVYYHKGLFARWRVMQQWQYDALLKAGLKPSSKFLDIGCGVLRLGLKLIPFLDDGSYFGTDPMEVYIRAAERYAADILRTSKRYQLLVDRLFDFAKFGQKFDFAMAHSVFTHMTPHEIARCLESLKPVMVRRGKLMFTLAVDPSLTEDFQETFVYNATTPMVRTRHANLDFLTKLSTDIGFKFEVFTAVPHPSQTAIVATF